MKRGILLALLLFTAKFLLADNYYWVNNNGEWTDYENHWATTSGGSIMHDHIPGINDNINFDINSFDSTGQIVYVDTSFIRCNSMNWVNVTNEPEFISQTTDSLYIESQLTLSADMNFNFFGLIRFASVTNGQNIDFNPANNILKSRIEINIPDGSLNVLSNLNIPQNQILLQQGTLDMNNNNMTFKSFNADEENGIVPTGSCALINVDSIQSNQSLFFHDILDVSSLDSYILISLQTQDSSYISFGNNITNNNIYISGSKKCFLESDLQTTGIITIDISGYFDSKSHNISCKSFISDNSFSRTIKLGNSQINTESFTISGSALNLESSAASLNFIDGDEYIYQSNMLQKTFENVTIDANSNVIFKSGINTTNITIGENSNVLIKESKTLNINSLTCNSDCGTFITIRGYGNDMPYEWPEEDYIMQEPIINCSNPITVEYLKLAYIEGTGATFTANNSYDQGNVQGWTINEPNTTDSYFWIGNKGEWNNPQNWSLSSGGAPQNCIPGKTNSVIFDANSFSGNDTVFILNHAYCKDITWENLSDAITLEGSANLFIQGNMTLHENLVSDFTGNMYFNNNDTTENSITTNKVHLSCPLIFDGEGLFSFADSLFSNSDIQLLSGNLSFLGLYASFNSLNSESDITRNLDISNSSILITGNDDCWNLAGPNLTLSKDSSEINLFTTEGIQEFNGSNYTYDSIKIQSPICTLNGSNQFSLISLIPGNNLILESNSNTSIDSMIVNGDCSMPITITTGNNNEAATITKLGLKQLNISGAHLSNINADTTGSVAYTANASTHNGACTGWTFVATPIGQTYYWLGNNKNWADISNWETSGIPATCLPGILDTVIINETNMIAASTDSILINKNQYCAVIDASTCNSLPVNFILEANLEVGHSIMLDNNVNFEYSEELTPNNLFEKNHGLIIAPDGNNADIISNDAKIDVNLYCKSYQMTDSIFIDDDLNINKLAGIYLLNGNLFSNENTISTDVLKCVGNNLKTLNIKNSLINIGFYAEFQNSTKLNVIADSSQINLIENIYANSIFSGGSQTFYDISLNMSENQGEIDDYLIYMLGSNHFHILNVTPGGTLQFQSGTTQTIDSAMNIKGTCLNQVELVSDNSGTKFHIARTNTHQDTVYSLIVSDMDIDASTIAMLSSDMGNNTGLIFDGTQAAIASYTMPYPACVASDLTFNNTSTSMWGGMDNLDYEWIIQDNDTTNTTNLEHYFANQGDFIIHLKATDTISGCYDIFTDTLKLVKQSAQISAIPENLTICEGENIEFTASSNQDVNFLFYNNNIELTNTTDSTYSATNFVEGDKVFVKATLNGCSQNSDTLEVSVNPLPVVSFTSEPTNAEICDGESITFTANGADLYQFYIDGTPITGMTTTNTFTSSVISDLAVVSVETKFTESGCTTWNTTDIVVHKYANPVVSVTSSVDPAIICQGEELNFTANGADTYEFFINGVSQAIASGTNTFSSNDLNNSDIVTVIGNNTHGCNTLSSFINVTVNPSPSLVLTSNSTENSICNGEELTYSAEGAAEFLYIIDGIPQGDFSTTSTYTSNSFTDGQTINLAGRINNCYDTLPIPTNITVNPNISIDASSEEICSGEDITITANGDSTYEFFVNGISQGVTSSENTLTSNSFLNGQIITVEGSAGACLPEGIEITVHNLPTPIITCNDTDTSVCAGEEISFTAEGAYQYEFYINGISNSSPTVYNGLHLNPNNGDIITLEAYSQFGCFAASSDSITIEVRPLPIVSLTTTDPTNLCTGDEVNLQASGAESYLFYLNGSNIGEASPENNISIDYIQTGDVITVEGYTNNCSNISPEAISYTVFAIPSVNLEATSEISICEGEEITAVANGASEYEFFLNGISQGTSSSNNIFTSTSLSDNDEITVVGSQNICSDTSDNSIIVDINEIPVVQLTTDIPSNGLCFGDTIHCSTSGANEFQFFLNGVALSDISELNSIDITDYFNNQEITVFGHNHSCIRETENPVEILLNRVFTTISTNTAGSTTCEGSQITAIAEGASEYEFFLNGTSLGSSSTNNSTTFDLNTSGQTLWVAGTDTETGCTELSAEITLNLQENPEITAFPSTTFCQNDSVLLQASPIGNDMIWLQNGNPISNGSNGELYIHETGNYTVQIIRGTENGVFTLGNNTYGQLGTGNTLTSETIVQSLIDEPIQNIEAGESHMIALDNNGQVYTWGINAYGNIGNGTYSDTYNPYEVPTTQAVKSIAAGYNHSIVLLEDSTLLSWGKNDLGQLGYGNFAASNFPNAVINLEHIIAIDAGKNHSIALDIDGNVYAWGNNEYGQLGTGDFTNHNEATLVTGLNNIVNITCGGNHNLAIDEDGNLWVWGANENGQLGLGDFNNRNTPIMIENFNETILIAAGLKHSLAYNMHGQCYAWGSNSSGQLGISGINQSSTPTKIDISNIIKLEAGESSSFAIRSDNSLWAWGQNNAAQLSLGHNNFVGIPEQSTQVFGIGNIAAGDEFTAVIWQDALQCESESININMIDVPDVEIEQNNNILSVNQGIAWQWMLNNSDIPGATSSELTVSAVGNYSVLIEFESGCSLLTNTITIGNDITDFINENNISIYPNPAKESVQITMNLNDEKLSEIQSWEIITTNADVIMKSYENVQAITKIDVSELSPAVYYLRIISKQQIIIKMLVIQ